jgi:hypothetical protein
MHLHQSVQGPRRALPFGALFACCGLALAGLGLSLTAAHAGCNSGNVANTVLLTSANCQGAATGTFGSMAVGGSSVAAGSGSTAVGGAAVANGDGSISLGNANTVNGPAAIGIGGSVQADGYSSISLGSVSIANGDYAIAMGVFAGNAGAQRGYIGIGAGTTSATYSTAIGNGSPVHSPSTNGAQATGIYSIAIGGGDHPTDRPAALANDTYGIAIGTGAVAKGVRSTSIGAFAGYNPLGAANNRNSSFGEEAGQNVNGGGNTATGLAAGVAVTGDLNSSFGNSAGITVAGNSNTTAGVSSGVNISGSSNAAYGDNAGRDVTGNANIAIGLNAGRNITASSSVSIGTNAVGRELGAVAIGQSAVATKARSVALGSNSVTTVANTVSVGSASLQRRIVNVAAAINATDAVNLGQVQALIAAGISRGGLTLVSRTSPLTTRRQGEGDKRETNLAARSGRNGPAGNTNSGADASRPGASARAQSEASASVASCDTSSTKIAAATQDHSTSSSSFAPIAQTGISFQQGGAGDGCVNLLFSAEAVAPGATLMEVRALLDDTIEAVPGAVYFTQGDDVMRSRAFNFLFPQVAPGPHRVEVHFRSSGEPGTVRVGMRTTMLQHVR